MKLIDRAENKRIVRSHNGIVNLVCYGKLNLLFNVLCADVNTEGVCGNSAVSGQGKNFGYAFVLFQLFNNGVLPSAAADYHNFHIGSPFISDGKASFL